MNSELRNVPAAPLRDVLRTAGGDQHSELVSVLHLVDSLAAGGAESVAVNLVNALPRDRWRPYLGTTRAEGPLAARVAPAVGRLRLARAGRWDLRAVAQLARFVRRERIGLVQAHGTAVFVAAAALALLGRARPPLLWHDHFGRYLTEERSRRIYGPLARRLAGVVAVNEPLAAWARTRLGVPADRVWYIPNFAVLDAGDSLESPLPGAPAGRIVCVANLRPQKDHPTLIVAMATVAQAVPDARLLLLGAGHDMVYKSAVEAAIATHGLQNRVLLYGNRSDVGAVLRASAVGVLSSQSEGLPLALLEYGAAGLPVVATAVGQCPEVLDGGRAGRLVPPGDAAALAAALIDLLTHPAAATALGQQLQARVAAHYSPAATLARWEQVYDTVLGRPAPARTGESR